MKNISIFGVSGFVSGSLLMIPILYSGGNPIPMTIWISFCGGAIIQSLLNK